MYEAVQLQVKMVLLPPEQIPPFWHVGKAVAQAWQVVG